MSKRDRGGREGGSATESKRVERERERERAYEGSCKTRLKTQDGFLNGLLERRRKTD